MNYKNLGSSDIEASEITLGTWNFSGGKTWGSQDEEEAIETIETAIDLGIDTFDAAEQYGDGYAEELLGRALSDYDRSEMVVTSKVSAGNLRPDDLRSSCADSLERLDTDYIDVYYVHWPNRDVSFEETLEALAELKEEGTIREVAISNFGERDLNELMETVESTSSDARPIVNQLPYNLLWRAIEYDIVPACEEHGLGITTYSSLMQGMLTGKFDSPEDVPEGRARTRHFSKDRPHARHSDEGAEELTFETIDRIREICDDAGVEMTQAALAWVLSKPTVDSVLVGARSPEQIRENAQASELSLSEDVLERLDEATRELKERLGSNPDMWQTDSRYR